ncbi:MAG: IMPACT family protein [Rhizobiaceae bacterium]
MTYFTVNRMSVTEYEEKRSRFIAHLVPILVFQEMLTRLREEHRKATHHVTATRQIDTNNRITETAKDDGEPAGTSGMPVLKTITGANLIDAGIIVTRYFGGTKLGTGGLARAYASAAKQAIAQANLVEWHRVIRRSISVPFELSSEIEREIANSGLFVVERDFHEQGISVTIEGPEKMVEGFLVRF